MSFVILPGTNKIVAAAFAGLRAEERKAKKAAPVEEPAPAKKVPTKPAAKKAAKKTPAKRAKRAGAKR